MSQLCTTINHSHFPKYIFLNQYLYLIRTIHADTERLCMLNREGTILIGDKLTAFNPKEVTPHFHSDIKDLAPKMLLKNYNPSI